jgi:hypothetical protein
MREQLPMMRVVHCQVLILGLVEWVFDATTSAEVKGAAGGGGCLLSRLRLQG